MNAIWAFCEAAARTIDACYDAWFDNEGSRRFMRSHRKGLSVQRFLKAADPLQERMESIGYSRGASRYGAILLMTVLHPLRTAAFLVIALGLIGASVVWNVSRLVGQIASLRPQRRDRGMVISSAPGATLRHVARAVFGPKEGEETFDALIADMQHEYFDASFRGAHIEALFARARGYLTFWFAVAADARVLWLSRGIAKLYRSFR